MDGRSSRRRGEASRAMVKCSAVQQVSIHGQSDASLFEAPLPEDGSLARSFLVLPT